MKKTIYFAGKHIVKDKIKSFSVGVHHQLGAKVAIEFIDESTEEEYFSALDFAKLRKDFDSNSLASYEANPKDFAWRQFDVPEVNLKKADATIRAAIETIRLEYCTLEEGLMKKAERRMHDVIKEYEAE